LLNRRLRQNREIIGSHPCNRGSNSRGGRHFFDDRKDLQQLTPILIMICYLIIMRNKIISEILEDIVNRLGEESRFLEGSTLIISGGAGFLGSYFLGVIHLLNEKFLAKPCHVISIDNYITGTKESFVGDVYGEHIKRVEADIRTPFSVPEPVVDYIIHAAGLASPVYYNKYPLETIESTIHGAKNLLELARQKKPKSFLLFSSSEIYGDPHPASIPTPEHYKGNVSCTGPRACYDESKRLAETLCLTYHQLYDIPLKIVRPFNVYGPGMKPSDHRVVPDFITRAIAGAPLRVHGSGNQTRTFCFISDAVVGFFKVLLSQKNGEVYNVGTDREEINMAKLAHLVAEYFDNQIEINLVDYSEAYPADEPRRRCPDITKISRELDFHPTWDLRSGLKKTVEWYRDILPFDWAPDL